MKRPAGLLYSLLFISTLLLAACAGAPAIPDSTYYRMGELPTLAAWDRPLSDASLEVQPFVAAGVHADQPLLYALEGDALRLRAYHYQLWVEAPTRLLQQRLIRTLRRAHVARLVVDNAQHRGATARISGRIVALERVPEGAGWRVDVALALRYTPMDDKAGGELVRLYRESRVVAGDSVAASAREMGRAVDAIYSRFLADLRERRDATP